MKLGTAPAILEIHNIEAYYGPVIALRGVTLFVRPGQLVAVLGGNGAGKTTLMRTVSGVMRPEKGKIRLLGKEIQGLEPDEIVRRGLVHVPEGREIFPLLTVAENLALGAYTRRDGEAEVQRDCDIVYDYFPVLKQRRTQHAATLSGGQQQMLAIGRGLMARPIILILDEPSLGLSPMLAREIFAILRRLVTEHGVTIVLVEQNAKAALDVADHGYVLELGRVVMDGSADQLKRSSDIQTFYLGTQQSSPRGSRRWKQRKTWR